MLAELSTLYLTRYLEAIRHNLLTILYRKVLLQRFNRAFVFYMYFDIGNIIVAKLTRRVSLVEQRLSILLEHMSSPLGGVRVTRSLILRACFVDRCLSFFFSPLCCLFFDLRILITLWYRQALLIDKRRENQQCIFQINMQHGAQ